MGRKRKKGTSRHTRGKGTTTTRRGRKKGRAEGWITIKSLLVVGGSRHLKTDRLKKREKKLS